jgi:hypothetical protein
MMHDDAKGRLIVQNLVELYLQIFFCIYSKNTACPGCQRVSKSARIEHKKLTRLQSGSQSMKQANLAFLHHLFLSLANSRKVSGRGNLTLLNCVPLSRRDFY